MKRVITDEDVAREAAAGRRQIPAPPATTVVTPGAWSKARDLGVVIDIASAGPDRVVDGSGVVVARGKTARLDKFEGAGPGKDVRLTDLITARDGAPMTAGIMSWGKHDAFPWTLDYDEVDLVLEGVLHITIDGRTLEGQVGDVVYIPKGSSIIFGTPSRTRVFYVTYPADWQAAAAPPRPQK